jgi:hypothetical protein
MNSKRGTEILTWTLSLLAVPVLYVAAYVLSTEVFCGRLGDTRYRFRLFRSVWHQRIFTPLLSTESALRPADPEFYGHVRNGASLPPADEDHYKSRE